jgi:ASC-1-like (ASCH) protein
MDHVAILRKSKISAGDDLLGDILAGLKTIESRWYVNKVSPWNNISAGDVVYLKESGCLVCAKAEVSKVIQYDQLTDELVADIAQKYGRQIDPHLSVEEFVDWYKQNKNKRYCILIFLEHVTRVEPFEINKSGFGISSAWLAVGDIGRVKK